MPVFLEIPLNGVIWMTGSSGFIGTYVANCLRHHGHRLFCFTNNIADEMRQLMDYGDPSSVRESLKLLGVPDVFIHLGWGGMEDPGSGDHIGRNVEETCTLVKTLFESGLRKFVFLGSINEYGARTGELSEDQAPEGLLTNYAKGKAMVAEYGFREAARTEKSFVSVRLSYTYGAGQRSGSLINKLFECHQNHVVPNLGPCEHYRDYIYVEEAAEGVCRIARSPYSGVVNLGGGCVIQVKEFVEKFWVILGGNPEEIGFGVNPMRAGEPAQLRCYSNLARLKSWTGWRPSMSLHAGLVRTANLLTGRTKIPQQSVTP